MKPLQLKLKESVELSRVARIIHQLARAGVDVRFGRRADRQMEASGIQRTDISTVLKKCRVGQVLGSSALESFHYRVTGNTVDEEGVQLVIRIEKQPSPGLLPQLAVIDVRWLNRERESHEEMQKVRVEVKKHRVRKI